MTFKSIMILAATMSVGQAHAGAYIDGEVIVKLKNQGQQAAYGFVGKVAQEKSMNLKQSWSKLNMYHFGLPKGKTVESAIAELRQDPTVQYAEPNYILSKSETAGLQQIFSADEVHQTSMQATTNTAYMATGANIGAQAVWTANNVGSVRPIVAVVDTGLDTTHPVFVNTNAVWTNPNEIAANNIDDDNNGYVDDVHGWNFITDSPNMYDDDGHGTHVSGIILSIDQNIYTTPLQEAKIQIMPLKFLDSTGSGSTSNAIRAIYYASNMGASVINNSWGGTDYSAALHEAVAYSYSKAALFVAAAGNAATDNDSTPTYPSGYDVPNVLSVAATTDSDYLASFSNYGAGTVHLGSPGVYILSTLPSNQFGTMSGTSMATPFVSGTAAQMKVSSPNMLGYQLKEILLGQDAQIAQLAGKVQTSGRLDSSLSVDTAKVATVETSQPAYTLTYQADRGLASSISGGGAGCGMVRALSGSDQEPPFGGGAFAVVGLLLLPLMVFVVMRLRQPENRRRHERFAINSDVRISVGDRELVGSISSISLGGVQINTSALLQDGGMVTMAISSPDGSERVEVAGRVVWSAANKAYGVAFDHTPQSALSRIADWTKGLKPAA